MCYTKHIKQYKLRKEYDNINLCNWADNDNITLEDVLIIATEETISVQHIDIDATHDFIKCLKEKEYSGHPLEIQPINMVGKDLILYLILLRKLIK